LPGWQEKFQKYGGDDFTVVGLALDAEGIAPAKRYYDRFGVTFPALVDPDYATKFGAVPKTFFVDEHGVVLAVRDWERRLPGLAKTRPVTARIRAQWSDPDARLDASELARLTEANSRDQPNLDLATQLGSRYSALGLHQEARLVLERAVKHYDPKAIAQAGGAESRQLGQAYFQLARAFEGDCEGQVRNATLSFFLNPTIGFGKQIARIISPEKFDGRPKGDFDNRFREATLRRLKQERRAWLDK
jgi:hypothetical protein